MNISHKPLRIFRFIHRLELSARHQLQFLEKHHGCKKSLLLWLKRWASRNCRFFYLLSQFLPLGPPPRDYWVQTFQCGSRHSKLAEINLTFHHHREHLFRDVAWLKVEPPLKRWFVSVIARNSRTLCLVVFESMAGYTYFWPVDFKKAKGQITLPPVGVYKISDIVVPWMGILSKSNAYGK